MSGVIIAAKALELGDTGYLPVCEVGNNQCSLSANYDADLVLRTMLNAFLSLSFVILASKRPNDKRAINTPIL